MILNNMFIPNYIANYGTINSLMKRQYCPIQTATLVLNGTNIDSIEEYYQTILYIQQHKTISKVNEN
jgi:hypothetical protein